MGDIFTNEDIFSSAYKYELKDDLYYAVEGEYIIEDNTISEEVYGGNKSAEDTGGDDVEEYKVKNPNFVLAYKLEWVVYDNKKQFGLALKAYMAKLIAHIKEKVGEERANFLKENLQSKLYAPVFARNKNFDSLRVYSTAGDGFVPAPKDAPTGQHMLFEQGCEDGKEEVGTKCRLYVLKDAVYSEKF